MKKPIITLIAALSILSSSAYAASDVFIEQIGQNLQPVSASQTVSIDDISNMASSAANVMRTMRSQFPANASSASLLVQNGDDQRAKVVQTGPGNLSLVMQTGMLNSVNVLQNGSGNSALVLQNGYRNMASVSQMGSNHRAFVSQQGAGNVAIISQR